LHAHRKITPLIGAIAAALLVTLGLTLVAVHAQQQTTVTPIDDAEQQRLAAVAGAGMVGSHAFDYLAELSDYIGARVTGSPEQAQAVAWGVATMKEIGLQNVHAESYQIWRGWTRISATAELISPIHRSLYVDAMGWVGSTPANGVDADVVKVNSADLANEMARNAGNWAGKILLITAPAPPRYTTEGGRGGAGRRGGGGNFGMFGKFLQAAHDAHAVAVIGGQGGSKAAGIHLTHTGILGFAQYYEIPVVSMAAEDQDELERYLDAGKTPRLHINVQNRVTPGPVDAANVVGDIPGTEHPEEVVVAGGHLDSWDLATGSTDNGCGAATALGAAEAIIRSGLKPKRTVRIVLFTGEEQGLLGSVAYVKAHESEMANHVAAIILDAGQGVVTGLSLGGRDELLDAFKPFAMALDAFDADRINSYPEFGTDTGPFTLRGVLAIGLNQDGSDYRLTHHSPVDTLDKVDPAILARNATVEGLTAFWIADRADRIAPQWPGDQTRKMLTAKGVEDEVKSYGLWDMIGPDK
jgi:carboxypeptidase Q